MTEKLNTHYYDGSLKEQFKKLVELQNTKTDFLQQKWDINEVIKEIHDNSQNCNSLSPKKKRNIVEILKLFYADRNGNYDPLNEIDTLDLLCRTWYYVKKLSLEDQSPFFQQLIEIKNGKCAQGRSTRIFQIYSTFF